MLAVSHLLKLKIIILTRLRNARPLPYQLLRRPSRQRRVCSLFLNYVC